MNDLMTPTMTIEQVIDRRNSMVDFVRKSLQENIDFGKIPGTDKNTLLKAGAEKLNTFYGYIPKFSPITTTEDWTGKDHNGEPFFYYHEKCQLVRDGVVVGEGDGSCNSWEKKYRYRASQRVCPNCGKPTIFKSRNPGEGFYCWTKKDGCGAKFAENAPEIVSQQAGQVPNPDIFDQVNTLLKMAQKRALVAATLIACNASEFFTQDTEDWAIVDETKVVESVVVTQTAPAPQVAATTADNGHAPAERKPIVTAAPTYTEPPTRQKTQRQQPPMSPVQNNKLTELWQTLHGGDTDDSVARGLDKLCADSFKHGIADATYEEGARMIAGLLQELRTKTQPA